MIRQSGIKAGPLTQRITIQRPIVATDTDSGEPVVTGWEDLPVDPKVWAAIETLRGMEYLASAEFRAGVTTRIRVRWRDDLTSAMRVLFRLTRRDGTIARETVYEVQSVLPQYQSMSEVHLMCADGVITEGGQP
ncbi:phage head closure protein [Paraburkholderia silvatlantica]|uniref:phage head closure protein n=1 Tax=Paraburkholderia silvatlantica TaxID=321895 RepID=UPI003751C786